MLTNHCYQGDCRDVMRSLIDDGVRVQCIVTSPPYWMLRDYGHPGQLGQEPTLLEFLDNMVEVFELCRELLADDGTLWLNMGDSYAGTRGAAWGPSPAATEARAMTASRRRDDTPIPRNDVRVEGLKPKDLVGQPWRLAFALQDAGWWLRQDIIWHKPNPMPESARDRCTKAHEYLFLLTKSEKYYFDQDAIREPASYGATPTGVGFGHGYDAEPKERVRIPSGWDTSEGGHRDMTGRYSKRNSFARETKYSNAEHGQKAQHRAGRKDIDYSGTRNKRSVWTIATQSYTGAHFATFPEALVEPCILAGTRPGDIVLDIFMGSGTVASVAQRLGRRWLGAELNPEYIALQAARTRQPGLLLEAS
jgi:DNA modification methylase